MQKYLQYERKEINIIDTQYQDEIRLKKCETNFGIATICSVTYLSFECHKITMYNAEMLGARNITGKTYFQCS